MGYRPARSKPMLLTSQKKGRNTLFLLFVGLSLLLFYAPLKLLVESSFGNELYSHIILIPLVTIYLIFTRRREIFPESSFSIIPGSIMIVAGVVFYLVGRGKAGA